MQIYQLGDSVYIYNDNGITININQFFLTLAIMFIVLVSLVNIVRVRGSDSLAGINDRFRGVVIRASKTKSTPVDSSNNPYL